MASEWEPEISIALPQLVPGKAWGYGPSAQCQGCGACCEGLPGAYFPHDIVPLTAEVIAAGMVDGTWIADCWEGDPRPDMNELRSAYYLRPRAVTDKPGPFCGSWGGACVNLSDAGCSLDWADRPSGCRALKPRRDGFSDCICDDGPVTAETNSAVMHWLAFHDMVGEAIAIAAPQMKG